MRRPWAQRALAGAALGVLGLTVLLWRAVDTVPSGLDPEPRPVRERPLDVVEVQAVLRQHAVEAAGRTRVPRAAGPIGEATLAPRPIRLDPRQPPVAPPRPGAGGRPD